jgi:hypothetical protein
VKIERDPKGKRDKKGGKRRSELHSSLIHQSSHLVCYLTSVIRLRMITAARKATNPNIQSTRAKKCQKVGISS